MSIPAWILDVFAAVMLLVAAVSAGQLVVARAWTRRGAVDADIAGSHLVMGVGMAGMLVAGLGTLPNAAWEAIFAVMTAWFAWSLWREAAGRGAGGLARGHHAPHLVHSAAMFYAFAALAGPAASSSTAMAGMEGMAGGSSSGTQTLKLPTLALVFVLALVAYTVRDLDRRACADGYFHVVGRRFAPAGPALATAGPSGAGPGGAGPGGAGPGGAGPGGAGPSGAGPGSATGTASGARAEPSGGGDTAVATVMQPRGTQAAQSSAAETGTARPDTARPDTRAERLLLAPGAVKACRVAMGVTMAFMLIIMI